MPGIESKVDMRPDWRGGQHQLQLQQVTINIALRVKHVFNLIRDAITFKDIFFGNM